MLLCELRGAAKTERNARCMAMVFAKQLGTRVAAANASVGGSGALLVTARGPLG
jgi:hypothetical protein